ncbi:MAG: aminoacyl--tRNA ligase-related protein [Candidatus Heimdallarchaeaceae archaeon]
MKQYLEGYYVFSGELPQESKEDITTFLAQFEKELQEKRPEGTFNLHFQSIEAEKLYFSIDSSNSYSPHSIVLRMRKQLAQKIGKKYRKGLRGFKITKYVIDKELEQEPIKEFTLPLTKNIEFYKKDNNNHWARIEIDPEIEEDFIEKGAIERILRRVDDKISKQHHGAKKEHHTVTWYSGEKELMTNKNPTKLLEKAQWIHHTNYRNQWILTPRVTAVVEAIKKIMVENVYKPLKYNKMMIPKLVDWSIWLRSGHAEGMFQGGFEPYFVVQPKKADPEYFEEVADYITITKTVPEDLLYEKISAPMGGLSYAQCPPFWAWLQGKTISHESLPIKVYDWSGPTYRYESGSAYGFERVDELHRIETLFIGTPEQVKNAASETRKKLRYVFDKIFDIEVREAKVMPWWLEQSAKSEDEGDDVEDMLVGTIDFEAYMPYRGTREESEWLEIQNISIIGDKYPKGFTVKTDGGYELWSGCGGGSFERFITAFIAQKGIEPDKWPEPFLKYLDEIPPSIKFL